MAFGRGRRTARWSFGVAALACGLSMAPVGTVAAAEGGHPEPMGYDAATDKGSLWHVADVVGAHSAYEAGFTGEGIGVALIDTGVSDVRGLDTGNVVHGPDLSFDSQHPELAHKDAYGHGTHLGAIIAGRDVVGTPASYTSRRRFNGIAPDATLLSVKVGASDGAVDVTQVIAAIDWVVAHRDDNGMNIRVLNLSYGTDSVQDPQVDPLAYAVEQAWRAGIVVVVAGGNDGSDHYPLAQPAQDANVLAVGADDTNATATPADDTVPAWGSRGTDKRHVDLVAPGVSVLGLRLPNGYVDERHASARVGTRFARASGTSQAAAVVSGAAALLLEAEPTLTPDEVKARLMSTADALPLVSKKHRGRGLLDLEQAMTKRGATKGAPRSWGTGMGSIEASRGSSHVSDGGVELRGEIDIFGHPWNPVTWSSSSAAGTAWSGGTWRDFTWSGDGWTAGTWRDVTWSAGTWRAGTWRDSEWASRTWRDGAWSAGTWREARWSAGTWRTADHATLGWLVRAWN